MSRTRVRLASLVAAGMLSLTGCADGPDDESTTPEPTTAEPSTSEPAATTEAPTDDDETTTEPPELSAEEQDEADIEETLQPYNNALGRAVIGAESVEGIYPFARDAAREQWVTQVMAYEAQGITFSGVSELEVLEVTLDGATAEAVVCADVSDVEAVDANGDSFITEDRLDESLNDFVLEQDGSPELGWYVVEDRVMGLTWYVHVFLLGSLARASLEGPHDDRACSSRRSSADAPFCAAPPSALA